MLPHLLMALVILGGADVARAAAQACDAGPLRIRNTNVWTKDGVLTRRDVLFREGRVAAIEPAKGRLATDGVRTIDGTGHTLLPGLIDSHLHFSVPGGLPPGSGGAVRTDIEAITGRQLLRSGVTSGRVHLATIDAAARLKARSADACEPLPRLQVGGPGISGALDRDYDNFQGGQSREDVLAKVARARDAGLDWIAIHDAHRFKPGVLEALAGAARQAGLRLLAAGGSAPEITAALAVGPDTLDYVDQASELYPAAVLDAIRAHRDLVLVPTLGVFYRTGAYATRPADLERASHFEFLAPADREFVLANARQALTGQDAARAQKLLPVLPAKFRQLRALGLPMAIGSDAGSPLHFQAGAIWWELEAWRAFGATAREALVAATEQGARVLRATDVGRLAVGARADFVLYRGNVEEGRFDQARVLAVAKAGVLFVADGKWVAPPDRP